MGHTCEPAAVSLGTVLSHLRCRWHKVRPYGRGVAADKAAGSEWDQGRSPGARPSREDGAFAVSAGEIATGRTGAVAADRTSRVTAHDSRTCHLGA